MKIAHVIWEMGIGGAERALYQLVREQRAHGIDADVIVGKDGGYYNEMTRSMGACVHSLDQNRAMDLSVAPRFRAILRDYDAIHFHSAEVGLFHLSTSVSGLRRYYTHRSGVFDYGLQQRIRYSIAGFQIRHHFHGVSGNTDQACVAAARLFGIERTRIPTTYNGIDFSMLEPVRPRTDVLREIGGEKQGRVVVGTSAKLRPWKRIHLLIEGFAHAENQNLELCIVGDGPLRPELTAQAESLGVADRVHFVGLKEHVGDYLQIMDIFVLPSGKEESFGNSVVEAMGMGITSLVFSDGGGMVEHIDHGVTGFVVDDVQHLGRVLHDICDKPELRNEIGGRARAKMRSKYSLDGVVQRYERLYGEEMKVAA